MEVVAIRGLFRKESFFLSTPFCSTPTRCSYNARERKEEAEDPKDHPVPFVNRLFESEIHGTGISPIFDFSLLVTWCHRVLLSCYLRPK